MVEKLNLGYKGDVMRFIIVFFIVLLLPTIANAELIISGSKTVYTGTVFGSGITLTESMEEPTEPTTGDIWRDIDDGTIYEYDGTSWEVRNKTQNIKDEIQIFKDNLSGVNDAEAKKCLRALGKVLLKLYKETIE